jgi:hypothetical protein
VFGQQQPEQMQFEKEARKRMNQKEYARIKPEPAHLTPGNSIYEKKQEEAATIKRIHARLADAADASRKQQAQMLDDAFASITGNSKSNLASTFTSWLTTMGRPCPYVLHVRSAKD